MDKKQEAMGHIEKAHDLTSQAMDHVRAALRVGAVQGSKRSRELLPEILNALGEASKKIEDALDQDA